MRKRDVLEIIIKIFGLFCIVQFIRSMPATFGAILIAQPEFITNKPLYVISMSSYPIVFLLLSIIFIFKSSLISKYLLTESTPMSIREDQNEAEKPVYSKLSFWIIIIGFFYLVSSTAAVLSGLPTIFIKMKTGWFLTHDPFLTQALTFIISLFCVFRSEKVEEFINKHKKKET